MNKLPKVVYKYFNWNDKKSNKILTSREIYFCNASKWASFGEYEFQFNQVNPEELRSEVSKNIWNLHNSDFKHFEIWFNLHLRIYKINFDRYHKLNTLDRDQYLTDTIERLIDSRTKDILANKPVYERAMRKFYFKHTGIFSTSLVNNSKSLWEWKKCFEEQNNDVVCIGLDTEIILEKLNSVGNFTFGVVNYQGLKNKVDLLGAGDDFIISRLNSISHTLPKNIGKDITDQHELRIMKFISSNTTEKSIERFLQLDDSCVTEIIIHRKANSIVKREVKKIAESINCSNISYYPKCWL